jgi:archaellum component FlaC
MNAELIVILILMIGTSIGLGVALIVSRRDSASDKKQTGKEIRLLEKQGANLEAIADRTQEQNTELTKANSDLIQRNTFLQEENIDLITLNEEYTKFVTQVYAVLSEDIGFLQGELAQKLSLDIPEVRTLHQGLQRLKEDITAINDIVKESERVRNE